MIVDATMLKNNRLATCAVRHIQENAAVKLHISKDAAQDDAEKRNKRAAEAGLKARYDVQAL